MKTSLLTLAALTVLVAWAGPISGRPPRLSKEEEARIDGVIERLIRADIGRLRGVEAKKAFKDFDALGVEAVPAMIRGLNRAARADQSCPVLVISTKLQRLLSVSDDPKLLEFAIDEIGADGALSSRHGARLRDLRVILRFRQTALARATPRPPPGPKAPRYMTTAELVKSAGSERGPRLGLVLTELEKRKGKEVLGGLSIAAGSYDPDTSRLGRELLDRHLGRLSFGEVRGKLKDDLPEVRRAAVRVVADKHPEIGDSLIDLLDDDSAAVRVEAHDALVRLSRGEDFGPGPGAGRAQREQAQRRWRDWWARRSLGH
jgi:hypothetical protein